MKIIEDLTGMNEKLMDGWMEGKKEGGKIGMMKRQGEIKMEEERHC